MRCNLTAIAIAVAAGVWRGLVRDGTGGGGGAGGGWAIVADVECGVGQFGVRVVSTITGNRAGSVVGEVMIGVGADRDELISLFVCIQFIGAEIHHILRWLDRCCS